VQEIWTSVQVKFVVGPSSGTYMTACGHWANCPVYYVFSLSLLANVWISCHAPICEELRCRDFIPLLRDKELVVVPDPDLDAVEAVVAARCIHTPRKCSSVAVCVLYQTLTTSDDRYLICSVRHDRWWDSFNSQSACHLSGLWVSLQSRTMTIILSTVMSQS